MPATMRLTTSPENPRVAKKRACRWRVVASDATLPYFFCQTANARASSESFKLAMVSATTYADTPLACNS